jgi:hypothetical protein
MASEDVDKLFNEGIAALRTGDKASARQKLSQVVKLDQFHEQAWVWLSACVDTDEQRIMCLQNAFTLNPNNEAARTGLQKLGALPADSAPAPDQPGEPIPAGGGETTAPPALAPGEEWRAAFVTTDQSENFKSDAIYVRTKQEEDERVPTRDLSDLANAWFSALIFKVPGDYAMHIRYGPISHIMVSIFAAVALNTLGAVLMVGMVLLMGRNPDFLSAPVQNVFTQWADLLGRVNAAGVTPGALRPAIAYWLGDARMPGFGGFTTAIAVSFGVLFVAYLLFVLLTTFVGQLFEAMVTNGVAEWMGGKGRILETTQALTLIQVPVKLASLIYWILLGIAPLQVAGIVWVGLSAYEFVQKAVAINTTHKLGIFASMGAIVLSGVAVAGILTMSGCLLIVLMTNLPPLQ